MYSISRICTRFHAFILNTEQSGPISCCLRTLRRKARYGSFDDPPPPNSLTFPNDNTPLNPIPPPCPCAELPCNIYPSIDCGCRPCNGPPNVPCPCNTTAAASAAAPTPTPLKRIHSILPTPIYLPKRVCLMQPSLWMLNLDLIIAYFPTTRDTSKSARNFDVSRVVGKFGVICFHTAQLSRASSTSSTHRR